MILLLQFFSYFEDNDKLSAKLLKLFIKINNKA